MTTREALETALRMEGVPEDEIARRRQGAHFILPGCGDDELTPSQFAMTVRHMRKRWREVQTMHPLTRRLIAELLETLIEVTVPRSHN